MSETEVFDKREKILRDSQVANNESDFRDITMKKKLEHIEKVAEGLAVAKLTINTDVIGTGERTSFEKKRPSLLDLYVSMSPLRGMESGPTYELPKTFVPRALSEGFKSESKESEKVTAQPVESKDSVAKRDKIPRGSSFEPQATTDWFKTSNNEV